MAPDKVMKYHSKYPDKPGPPKKSMESLSAWENGIDDYNNLNNDTQISQSSRTSFFEKGGLM